MRCSVLCAYFAKRHLTEQELTIKCKKMYKMTIFYSFFAIFRVFKLDYGKYRKIVIKFLADVISFIYFPQSNTLSSVLKM